MESRGDPLFVKRWQLLQRMSKYGFAVKVRAWPESVRAIRWSITTATRKSVISECHRQQQAAAPGRDIRTERSRWSGMAALGGGLPGLPGPGGRPEAERGEHGNVEQERRLPLSAAGVRPSRWCERHSGRCRIVVRLGDAVWNRPAGDGCFPVSVVWPRAV